MFRVTVPCTMNGESMTHILWKCQLSNVPGDRALYYEGESMTHIQWKCQLSNVPGDCALYYEGESMTHIQWKCQLSNVRVTVPCTMKVNQ